MFYYPVVIPTLNRYEHFRRCVESLARNIYADLTELVIGLDYPPSEKYVAGYQQIKEYLPSISGFKKVTIFERDTNWGPGKNNTALIEYVYEYYDAVITTEDDNEFSPCFLDYMNKMLNHYRDDKRIATISGYLPADFHCISSTGLIFTRESNAWGCGIWRNKTESAKERRATAVSVLQSLPRAWKSFRTYPACFRMLISMVSRNTGWGDVIRTQNNIMNGTFQVRPAMSLVRNWGNDGSGLHCINNESIAQQPISDALTFEEPTNWEPYYSKKVSHATFRLTWPKNNLLFAGKLIITVLLYIRYRIICLFRCLVSH